MVEIKYRFSRNDDWTIVEVSEDEYEAELQYWRERTSECGGEVK